MYVSTWHICFHSNVFSKQMKVSLSFFFPKVESILEFFFLSFRFFLLLLPPLFFLLFFFYLDLDLDLDLDFIYLFLIK
jgi:hypothetical protein